MEPRGKKTAWWIAGAVVLVVAILTVLERLIEGPPQAPAPATAAAAAPAPPEVLRLDEGGVEIRHDFFRRTTIRLGDAEAEQALYDCLTAGIEEAFVGGTEGWSRGRVRDEAERVQDGCLAPVPELPAPPGR